MAAAGATIGIAGAGVLGTVFGTAVVDRFGRRPLLLIAFGFSIVFNIVFLIIFEVQDVHGGPFPASKYIYIIAAMLFTVGIAIGLNPIMWFIASEMVPQSARSVSCAFSMFTLYLGYIVSELVFFPLEGAIRAFSFLLFIIPLVILTVFFYFKLPETKNTPIDEVLYQLQYGIRKTKPKVSNLGLDD